MSKMEEYQAAKDRYEKVASFAQEVSNGRSCDKFGAKVRLSETYSGSYGSSSCFPWSEYIVTEVEKQVIIELRDLVVRAAARLRREVVDAKESARAEAEEVLAALEGEE